MRSVRYALCELRRPPPPPLPPPLPLLCAQLCASAHGKFPSPSPDPRRSLAATRLPRSLA
jgi:hypothetical protein